MMLKKKKVGGLRRGFSEMSGIVDIFYILIGVWIS